MTMPGKAQSQRSHRHRSRQAANSEAGSRERTQPSPKSAEDLHRQGLVAAAGGDSNAACAWIAAAIREAGPKREFCESLAGILAAQGKHRQAAACYEQALSCAPQETSLLIGLADALIRDSRPREAASAAARLLQLRPRLAQGWQLLGVALHESGNYSDAAEAFHHAADLEPSRAESHFDLGLTLARLGEVAQAESAYRRAVQLRPAYPEAHNNLGNVLRRAGQPERAVPCYQIALKLRPDFLDARYNLGLALQAADRLNEAEECYRAVLRRNPDMSAAHNNLGNTLQDLGSVQKAIDHYRRAVQLSPENAGYRVNLGMAQLLTGNFRDGWRNYAARSSSAHAAALWDGSPLNGNRVLLRAEQGFGDTLQFIRYARMLKASGGSVWASCPPPLARLLRTHADIDGLDTRPEAPLQYEWQAPLLELPRIFETLADRIPGDVPYLVADQAVAAWWAGALSPAGDDLRVGIAWRGSPDHRNDQRRSIDARQLSVLAGTPNARFIPLQKEYPGGDPAAGFDWEPLARPLTDFADTAALMMNLDVIVSVDTAVAHLAGALARPVWTLLPMAPDWRWLLDREDSPWYPTMRLFRQTRRGDWASVLMRVGQELEEVVKRGRDPLG